MTPDQLRHEEVEAWFVRASGDLRSAKLLMAAGERVEALFHCQQAAEKALKGFLTFHRKPFRKTHDLGELAPACLDCDASLASVCDGVKALTKYAWTFRYPGAPYDPDTAEAAEAYALAEAAVRAIEQRLPAGP